MGLFGGLIKLAVDVATVPLDVVSDVIAPLDGKKPEAIRGKTKEIVKDVKEIVEDLL